MNITDIPDASHCPRCGLRGEHECLSSCSVVFSSHGPAAQMAEEGADTGWRERRTQASMKAGKRERVRSQPHDHPWRGEIRAMHEEFRAHGRTGR